MKAFVRSSKGNLATIGGWNEAISTPFDMSNFDARYVRIRIPCKFEPVDDLGVAQLQNTSFRVKVNGSILTLAQGDPLNYPTPNAYDTRPIRMILVDILKSSYGITTHVHTNLQNVSVSFDDPVRRNDHFCQSTVAPSQTTGTYTDFRDGKVYKTVLMPDGKWWAAENLAWAGAGVDYDNNPANRAIYGRLYTWAEANASCPDGTHLPSETEWTAMETACGTPATLGTRLKSSSLWSGGVVGTDEYGFNAVPGGYYFSTSPLNIGTLAGFQTSTSIDVTYAVAVLLSSAVQSVTHNTSNAYKVNRYSVRFIVDSGNVPDTNEIKSVQVDLFKSTTLEWNNATMEIH